MRLYSSHFRAEPADREQPPLLVKEGLSWPCLLLGWIGLLLSGSWIAALLVAAASLLTALLLHHLAGSWPIAAGLQLLLGLCGNDLRRWELGLRGFVAGPLVAGRDAEAALLRLLDGRPELLGDRP